MAARMIHALNIEPLSGHDSLTLRVLRSTSSGGNHRPRRGLQQQYCYWVYSHVQEDEQRVAISGRDSGIGDRYAAPHTSAGRPESYGKLPILCSLPTDIPAVYRSLE